MDKIILFLVTILCLFVVKSCSDKNREIRKLKNEVQELKYERKGIWIESCRSSVYRSCFYADCAVTPIEIMQDKICKEAPEDL
jgi:hypothetical protein